MAALSSSAPFPSTPRKNKNTLDNIIRKLNDEYGLGIEVPDNTLTPSQRASLGDQDPEYKRWDVICRRINFLHCRQDGSLDRLLESFGWEVRAASQKWVPSYGADGTTPGQQLAMQTILLDLLDRANPVNTPSQNHFARSTGGPFLSRPQATHARPKLFPPVSSQPTYTQPLFTQPFTQTQSPFSERTPNGRAKRASIDEHLDQDDDSPKRKKAALFGGGSGAHSPLGVDAVPTRRRLGHSPGPQSSQQGRDSMASYSIHAHNTNVSLSRSMWDDEIPIETQTTVDAFSQSPKRIPHRAYNGITASQSVSYPTLPPSQPPYSQRPVGTQDNPISLDEVDPEPVLRRRQHRALSQAQVKRSASPSTTVYSSIPEMAELDSLWNIQTTTPPVHPTSLEARLKNIWPKFPSWLHDVPFGIAWELTRICCHCGVDLDHKDLKYNPAWVTQGLNEIWKNLREHDLFRGKLPPERPSAEAFAASLSNFESKGNAVILSATLDFNPDKTGPLFLVDLKPLRLDQGCRLTRRFGPDRFFEILIPSPTSSNAPSIVQAEGGSERVIEWLTQRRHAIAGRDWQAFYTKDAGYRQPAKEFKLGPEAKPIFKDRVHFFAESGHNFRPQLTKQHQIPVDEPPSQRTMLKVSQMLQWLLEIEKNESQFHLKLFSRIQLGLSKTFPIMVFGHGQIREHQQDIVSPIGKIMNDGVGLMSRSVARKIRDVLGLADIPSAVQGRMGPAKGMWLMDVSDVGDEDWIETYPSQRKWKCDALDMHQRTLEIRSVASELKSAGLNLQFLPVLEDRAKDRALMRSTIAKRLTKDLQRQFDGQKAAFKRPLQFRQWMAENFSGRANRVSHGRVPFLGGLPESKEETMNFLLDSGFDPKKQKYLQDLAWELQKQKCDTLKTKLNIKVGRSTYAYMVVDFWGVLKEDEVHFGFSSKFRDETDDTSCTLLAGRDILVARSPAHFPSDVQKVKAVFKSELHALKDVIVFPATGNIALADKLSGGDYDGDLAWVCWDPDIVDNFVNADVPEQPDLSHYLRKNKTTFGELVQKNKSSGPLAREKAVYEMISKSFQFAMQPNFLGICTNFKERLCYHSNSVSSDAAIILSTLVGNLVDQSKQGIIFNNTSWDKLRKQQFSSSVYLDEPAYKRDNWGGHHEPQHIIDFLKFKVAKPAIDAELTALHQALAPGKNGHKNDDDAGESANYWDQELVVYFEKFKEIAAESKSTKALFEALKNELSVVDGEWKKTMGGGNRATGPDYQTKVASVYEKYRAITLRHLVRNGTKVDSKMVKLLEQSFLPDPELNYWSLLKASTAFKLCYRGNPRFVWRMAGRQLAFIKAQMASGGDGAPALVTPLMYAGLSTDQKFVKQYIARLEGEGSEYPDGDDLDGDNDIGGRFGGFGDY